MIYTPKNGIDFAKAIVKEVDNRIKRVYWTNDEIDKWFGKRSVEEILHSGNTCFMNSCSDVTLASSFLMNQHYISHRWVIEEYSPTEHFDFNRLHFVLEFIHDKRMYVLNYQKLNDVYIYEGKYKGRKDLPNLQMMRIPKKKIHFNRSLHRNISNSDIESRLKNYSLEKNINRLKQDNSIENFENFKKLHGEKFIFK